MSVISGAMEQGGQGLPRVPWDRQVVGKGATPLASIKLAASSVAGANDADRAVAVEAARQQVIMDSAKHSHPRLLCSFVHSLMV